MTYCTVLLLLARLVYRAVESCRQEDPFPFQSRAERAGSRSLRFRAAFVVTTLTINNENTHFVQVNDGLSQAQVHDLFFRFVVAWKQGKSCDAITFVWSHNLRCRPSRSLPRIQYL